MRDRAARALGHADALEQSLEQSEYEAKKMRSTWRVIEGGGVIAVLLGWLRAVSGHKRAMAAVAAAATMTAAVGIGIVIGDGGLDAPDNEQQRPAPTVRRTGSRSPGDTVTPTPPAHTVPPEPTLEPTTAYATPSTPSTPPAGTPPAAAGPGPAYSPEVTAPGRSQPSRHTGRPAGQPPGETSPGQEPENPQLPVNSGPRCPLRVDLLVLRVCL